MTSSPEALASLIYAARGNRPQSLGCAEAEDVLNVALALLIELSASNDRIDRLERLVAELRGEPVSALRDLRYPDGLAAEERREAMEALLMRALRIFLDPRVQGESAPA